jgi:hypothetical protein
LIVLVDDADEKRHVGLAKIVDLVASPVSSRSNPSKGDPVPSQICAIAFDLDIERKVGVEVAICVTKETAMKVTTDILLPGYGNRNRYRGEDVLGEILGAVALAE